MRPPRRLLITRTQRKNHLLTKSKMTVIFPSRRLRVTWHPVDWMLGKDLKFLGMGALVELDWLKRLMWRWKIFPGREEERWSLRRRKRRKVVGVARRFREFLSTALVHGIVIRLLICSKLVSADNFRREI